MESVPVSDNRVSKTVKRKLDALIGEKLISPDAVKTVENLACPFPDDPMHPTGWPDANGGVSVPAHWVWEQTIMGPTDLADGETWDIHAVCLPILNSSSTDAVTYSINKTTGALTQVSSDGSAFNTFSYCVSKTGTVVPFGSAGWKTGGAGASPDNIVGQTPARLLCQGIELQNVSPVIYRGAKAYAYHSNTGLDDVVRSPVGLNTSPVPYMARCQSVCLAPPEEPAQIINLANTYQGDATAGVVCVNKPLDFVNPVRVPFPSELMLYVPSDSGEATATLRQNLLAAPVQNWGIAGCFITGIPKGGSYVLHAAVNVELFPCLTTEGNTGALIQSLAKPMVPHSPLAFEILSGVLRELPAGFDYKDNPLGEWFSRVLGGISDVAPVIGNALGTVFPPAKLIGSAVGTAGKALQKITSKPMKPLANPIKDPKTPKKKTTVTTVAKKSS